MSPDLRIAPMTRSDVDIVVEWAAAEGWNPGIDDADAFYAADPGGFFMGWVGDVPVAAISVVRHSESFGFLGFYVCSPAYRGRGYGYALWRAGMAYLDARTVGLDGVVAQQANYRKSGFVFAHQTQRYEGHVAGHVHSEFVAVGAEDLAALLVLDRAVQGVSRDAYLSAWCMPTPTRHTLALREATGVIAMGTIRACRSGHKIGPLIAPDYSTARALLESLVASAGAERIVIDVPDPNVAGMDLATDLDFVSSFACARMYAGPPPSRDLSRIFGEVSFELG